MSLEDIETDSPIVIWLATLTDAIFRAYPERAHSLGPTYGVDFENDVFVMKLHMEDCPCDAPQHSAGCKFDAPNFRHKRTGLEVDWYKYLGRRMEMRAETPEAMDLQAVFSECIASVGRRFALSAIQFRKLPLPLRQQWWRETDYGRLAPSDELKAEMLKANVG